jgi:hypothetical protein
MTLSLSRKMLFGVLVSGLLLLLALPAFAQSEATPTPGGSRSGGRTVAPTTEVAGESDMEDWVLLEGNGVSLMAPPEFEGGDIDTMLEILDSADEILGEDFAAVVEIAQQNPDLYKLFAIAPTLMEDGVLTNINITGTPLGMTLDMDTILELLPSSFPDSVEIVESEVLSLGDYEEVGRLVVRMEVMGLDQEISIYAFLIDEVLYGIAFTTSVDAAKELNLVFEQIASTFEVTGE